MMRKSYIKAFISFVMITGISIQMLIGQVDVANYVMNVDLDWQNKSLDGQTVLTWKNISNEPITELQFHLYYNAFKNTNSTFLSKRSGLGLIDSEGGECRWSWSEITDFKDQNGKTLTDSMSYIQTDDSNAFDQTVLSIKLIDPVLPGEIQKFEFSWQAKIPKIMPRTGYNKDYLFMVQWFPKVGVLEPAGMRGRTTTGWNCHQYHSSGEYYANFGDYEVNILADKSLKLGFTGVGTQSEHDSGKNLWAIKANSVIDFAWTASPHFVEIKDKWKDVDIHLFCYPGHEHFSHRFIGAVKNSLDFLTKKLGDYPYPKITIVEPPIHGLYTGGMEYPMLISSLGFCFIPTGIRATEVLTIHEFIHQYFMQMIATNETEDPWMDEGFTTYYEGRIVDEYYGGYRSTVDLLDVSCSNREFNRYELINSGDFDIAPAKYVSWEFPGSSYGNVAYNKAASVIKTLEGLLGQNHFDAAMKSYFKTWQFKHPGPNDFIEHINDYVETKLSEKYPNGMNWFLQPALFEDVFCDYELLSIEERPLLPVKGFYDNLDDCEEQAVENTGKKYRYAILVKRHGELVVPTSLVCSFKAGEEQIFKWDAKAKEATFIIESNEEIYAACLDPEFLNDLDINRINNGRLLTADKDVARKYGLKTNRIVHYFLELASALF
jgi:hypothetical protein